MNSNTRNFLEIGLVIALIVVGIFLFNQMQNLDTTRDDLTAAQSDGTQAVATLEDAGTAMANNAASIASEAANQLSDANATATQAANDSADALDSANSTIADVEDQLSDTNATATQAANDSADALNSANADATQAVSEAESTLSSVEADALAQANNAATQEAESEAENEQLTSNLSDAEATSAAALELQMTEAAMRDDLEDEVAGLATVQAVANDMANVQMTAIANLSTSLDSANETGDSQAAAFADAEATIAALEEQVASQTDEITALQQSDTEDANTLPTNTGEINETGLVRYETETIEIYLPDDYFIIDPSSGELDMALRTLDSMGEEYRQFIELLEQNPDTLVLFAARNNILPGGFVENMNILTVELPVQVPLQTLLPLVTQGLPDNFNVIEQEIIELGERDAIRIITDIDFGFVTSRIVQYVIVENTTMYIITLATSVDEFEGRLDVFEAIATTFRVLDE